MNPRRVAPLLASSKGGRSGPVGPGVL